jgi:hypothetical protein
VRKHEPAISFTDISGNPTRCANITDFAHFDPAAADLEWIVPNLCNDTHSCNIAAGDAFQQGFVPQILASPAWQAGGVLFITWDEGVTKLGGGGNVPTIVIAPRTSAGFRSDRAHNHYSLLHTIQTAWGLGCLANTCAADDLREFFDPALVADAGPDQAVRDTDGAGVADVTLNGTGSSNRAGDIASYAWYEGDTLLATGSQPTLALSVGEHALRLRIIDDAEGWAVDDMQVSVGARGAPVATAPAQTLKSGTLGTSSVPVALSWSAADTDGVATYALEESSNAGLFTALDMATPTTSSVTRQLTYDSTYQYRVRATDTTGAVSECAVGQSFQVDVEQEASAAIV